MFTGSGKSPPIQESNTHQTIEDYVNSLDQVHRWPFSNISGMENLDHVASAISSGNCALVSDGSFSKSSHQAAAAWVVGNEAIHRQIQGQVPCAGNHEIHSAYRGELAGIYRGLTFIKFICQSKQIQRGKILLGCDGLGAIKKSKSLKSLLLRLTLITLAPFMP